MESNIKLFKNDEFGKLEVLVENGKEYFPAKEVATILGYKDPLKAINTHCKEKGWVIRPVLSNGGKQEKKFIDEGNLYRLIVKSKLPQAEKFESWVFEEVLPTIRKTGMYFTENVWDNLMKNPMKLGKMIIEYAKVKEENEKLNDTLEEQRPVIEFTDNVLSSENVVTTTVIAKQYGMSARKFNKLLNELGIQYKVGKVWVLYSKYENKGYTKVITQLDNNNEPRELTKWTQKGRKFLYEVLRDEDIVPINEEI
jgi:prophage antirepressor-like protein